MNVARPPGGFNVRLDTNVAAFVAEIIPRHPELAPHWDALIERMKTTAHLDGGPATYNRSRRIGTAVLGGYRFKLAWSVLGANVTILYADF